MGVIRKRLKAKFSQIPNWIVRNPQIPNSPFRVIIYCWSLTNDWKINNTDVQNKCGFSDVSTVTNAWKWLLKYKIVSRVKCKDEKGSFTGGFDYVLEHEETEEMKGFWISLKKEKEEKKSLLRKKRLSVKGKNPVVGKTHNRGNTVTPKNPVHSNTDTLVTITSNTKKSSKNEKEERIYPPNFRNEDFILFFKKWIAFKEQNRQSYQSEKAIENDLIKIQQYFITPKKAIESLTWIIENKPTWKDFHWIDKYYPSLLQDLIEKQDQTITRDQINECWLVQDAIRKQVERWGKGKKIDSEVLIEMYNLLREEAIKECDNNQNITISTIRKRFDGLKHKI